MSKKNGYHGIKFEISEKSTVFANISHIGYFKDYSSSPQASQIRAYLLNDKGRIVKAKTNKKKSGFDIEAKLSKGTYDLIIGVYETPSNPYLEKQYSLIFHSTSPFDSFAENDNLESEKIMGGVLADLAAQRGQQVSLVIDNSVRRYILASRSLGLCLFLYVNRSPNFYNIVDEMDAKGVFLVDKDISDGRLRISLQPNSKKMVTFRYEDAQAFEISILKTAIAIRT